MYYIDVKSLQNIQSLVPFNKELFRAFITLHVNGLSNITQKVEIIVDEVELTVFNGMSYKDLIDSAILVAAQNIVNDIEFETVATRLSVTKTYLTSLTLDANAPENFFEMYKQSFKNYIKRSSEEGILNPKLNEIFDLDELAESLKPELDDIYTYIGIITMQGRHMTRNRDHSPAETPQFTWMRIAMGMSLLEEDPTRQAKTFYRKLSNLDYIPGSTTMIGAGTTYSVLSNCYLLDTEDDLKHIFENVKNVAMISKATGGIGMSISKLRAEGSPIKSNNTVSSGPIPFMHVMDATIRAVSRAGYKLGAVCMYMENWHLNFPEFLDLKQNAGDEYRRTRTANTAVYISDEFMKRVVNGEDWYLFDPAEVPELTELYGEEFSKKYNEYVERANNNQMRAFNKVPAREQFKKIITSLLTTAHPWLTFKDPINVRALNNNTGTIHCSNLCTEICLPQDRENIAVCNLLTVNLATHIKEDGATVEEKIDWNKLEDSVRVGMRHLDNLIDVNEITIPEAKKSDTENRAVGLGVMGFAESLEAFGFAYDSEEAYDLIDKVIEFVSYMSIDESANLAEERGSYSHYEGSLWSQGWVPFDTIKKLEANRKEIFGIQKENSEEVEDNVGASVETREISPLQSTLELIKGKISNGVENATSEESKELYGLLDQLTKLVEDQQGKLENRSQFKPVNPVTVYTTHVHELSQEIKTEGRLESQNGYTVLEQNREIRLDWERLRARVKRGMRNATTMMIPPNASTGLVAGTTPGFDPRFAQIFSRNTNNGKFLDINHNLFKDLQRLGIWEKVKDQVISNYGDISSIPEIPDNLKVIYKTSFQVSPYAYIEVASRAQKWIDQSISRNMYLETRDVDEIMEFYLEAWRRGLKTTYYLHAKPRHKAEQSTVKVNKAKNINKKGFGAVSEVKSEPTVQLSLDPQKEVKGFGFAKANEETREDNNANNTGNSQSTGSTGGFGFGKTMEDSKGEEKVEFKATYKSYRVGKACPVDPAERALCDACQ